MGLGGFELRSVAQEAVTPLSRRRLDPFRRHRDGERGVRVRSDQQQDRDQAPILGEVDVDVPEVRFQAIAWLPVQRGIKRRTLGRHRWPMYRRNGVVRAPAALLDHQAPEDLHRRVTLLGRCLLVVGEDLIDRPVEATQLRTVRPAADVRPRLRAPTAPDSSTVSIPASFRPSPASRGYSLRRRLRWVHSRRRSPAGGGSLFGAVY